LNATKTFEIYGGIVSRVKQRDLWGNTVKLRLIVTGSREMRRTTVIEDVIREANLSTDDIECVISGGCRGVERQAEEWAHRKKLDVKNFGAKRKGPDGKNHREWGYAVTAKMIEFAKPDGMLIVIGDTNGKWAKSVIREAEIAGLRIHTKHLIDA